MSRRSEPVRVDERMLRDWPLPPPGDSKNARGRIVVVGGSERSPGAVVLAGLAALRVGAGRLTLVAPRSIALPVAVAVPEAGVLALGDDGARRLLTDSVRDELTSADAVLVGPGIADAELARRLVEAVHDVVTARTGLVLDAFALGVLPELDDAAFPPQTVLTPNSEEAGILLGQDIDDVAEAVVRIATRYGAVTTCYGEVSAPGDDAGRWHVAAGGAGLGTSGSGDVLAGAIAGLLARGADAAQSAVWATHLHAAAGDRLAGRIAPIGFLARELCEELPRALAAIR
jgi:hydroxyethylthiazole kinase-like uncharacterized protein yjeF